jgi:glycosyltransferase involved in cell wall biosynthesis
MDRVEALMWAVLALCAGGIALLFVLYPLAVLCAGALARRRPPSATGPLPGASLLVAMRNAESLAAEKVENALALEAPGPLQLVFASDGSTDRTADELRAAGGDRIEVVEIREHHGKAHALNQGAARCREEILVFSDADALLASDALRYLLAPFADPEVGGVCGQRVIAEHAGELARAQGGYVAADSALKRAESRLGSVTSNDGKLYAVRRRLFRPIDPGATDDLFSCLSVVEQGARFVFEPRALAFIRTPSRSAGHEISRRRRIVARSLRGIAAKRALLNPLRHGAFGVQLLVNKVLRRFLPLLLLGCLLASAGLAFEHVWVRLFLLLQLAFYGLALGRRWLAPLPVLGKASGLAYYFCVGNLGTLLGLVDFLNGRRTVKWEPRKAG